MCSIKEFNFYSFLVGDNRNIVLENLYLKGLVKFSNGI